MQTNSKKTRGGNPPPQNSNRLSLIQEIFLNTSVATSVSEDRSDDEAGIILDGKASTEGARAITAAKHPLGNHSGKASARTPWQQSIRPNENHGGKASAKNDDHRRGKASTYGAITLTAAKHLHERGP
jgi:hypothetical protein